MEQRELMEQVQKLVTDNPAKFIKIRDVFDEVFENRVPGSGKGITDQEFERLRDGFRDIDVTFSWCTSKESVYQLHKAVRYHRSPSRSGQNERTTKSSAKTKKKGLFGIFG